LSCLLICPPATNWWPSPHIFNHPSMYRPPPLAHCNGFAPATKTMTWADSRWVASERKKRKKKARLPKELESVHEPWVSVCVCAKVVTRVCVSVKRSKARPGDSTASKAARKETGQNSWAGLVRRDRRTYIGPHFIHMAVIERANIR
jgi:hypothetical protein